MVEHLRRARTEHNRACRVIMDLPGRKLRTGPIEPVPGTMFQIRWGLPGIRMEPRAERVIESAAQSLRQKTLWKCQREQHREESQELAGLRPHRIPPLSHLRRTFL